MMKGRRLFVFVCLLIFATQCKEPYAPPVSAASQNILVVDGTINTTDSIAQVLLSRTVPLSSLESSPPESRASVVIENDLGQVSVLTESPAGRYSLKKFFASDRNYKLHVQTADGLKYSSDLIKLQQTPPIDSLTWVPSHDGLALNVNAHDDSGNTKYYRWKLEETWEYNSPYESDYIYNDTTDTIIPRPANQNIFICWRTAPLTKIELYTTVKLQRDVVNNYQLVLVPVGSQKLSREYSVLVKQQALSEEAYNYWYQLRTTTENLGGLFDPLPSQVNGNIVCESDPGQRVLGFFSGGSIASKRVFIRFTQLPKYLVPPYLFGDCFLDKIPIGAVQNLNVIYKKNLVWVTTYGYLFIDGYEVTSANCADCRTQGGTTTKPSFWQ